MMRQAGLLPGVPPSGSRDRSRLPVVQLRGVSKKYPGEVHALRDVTMTVQEAELVAIVGASGSGKSTLLHLIGSLDRPSCGTVQINGYDVARLTDRQLSALRAGSIGFVFQHFHLAEGVSALDNVADGLLYAGVARSQRRARARAVLQRVGLAHRERHRPHELSGGERQRVAIARAVVGEPSLLLADEPTGNLDSSSGEGVMSVLRGLHRQGTTVMVITHDERIASGLPRRISMRDGRIVNDQNESEPRERDQREPRERDQRERSGTGITPDEVRQ